MLKVILTIPVVIAGCLIGNWFSIRLSRRRDILAQFIALLEQTDTRLRYTQAPLAELFRDNFMGFSFCTDESFGSQWGQMLRLHEHLLDTEDMAILTRYGDEAGSSDADAQHKLNQMVLSLLRNRLDDAQKKTDAKSRLYRVCGFSGGMCLALLLL